MRIQNNQYWVIDWNKVTTFDHIKEILMSMNLSPVSSHPDFEFNKHLCKLIDADGKEIITSKG